MTLRKCGNILGEIKKAIDELLYHRNADCYKTLMRIMERYGDYEQVNGAVANDLMSEMETLKKEITRLKAEVKRLQEINDLLRKSV